jgi:hypothetical protein
MASPLRRRQLTLAQASPRLTRLGLVRVMPPRRSACSPVRSSSDSPVQCCPRSATCRRLAAAQALARSLRKTSAKCPRSGVRSAQPSGGLGTTLVSVARSSSSSSAAGAAPAPSGGSSISISPLLSRAPCRGRIRPCLPDRAVRPAHASLVSPWLSGLTRPPDILIVNDPAGLAMMAGLIAKEVPFLLPGGTGSAAADRRAAHPHADGLDARLRSDTMGFALRGLATALSTASGSPSTRSSPMPPRSSTWRSFSGRRPAHFRRAAAANGPTIPISRLASSPRPAPSCSWQRPERHCSSGMAARSMGRAILAMHGSRTRSSPFCRPAALDVLRRFSYLLAIPALSRLPAVSRPWRSGLSQGCGSFQTSGLQRCECAWLDADAAATGGTCSRHRLSPRSPRPSSPSSS